MSESQIEHFLIVYDIAGGRADVESFGKDYAKAVAAYKAAEERYNDGNDYEVVLLGSDSYDTLERTHASYFELAHKHADNIVGARLAELGLR